MRYKEIRDYIYKLDPETAHKIVEYGLRAVAFCPPILGKVADNFCFASDTLEQEILGLRFYNPIGLAAGFDKNATMIKGLSALGFSHIEVGTLTPKAQSGNPKPRLFRFVEEESIQNAMGFNNDGIESASSRLQKLYPYSLPIGLNIGKNKNTEEKDALSEYLTCIDKGAKYADYVVVNISSPNTPGLRNLFNEGFISSMFEEGCKLTNKPIFLKLSPDMSIDDALTISSLAIKYGAKGLICTNTTVEYTLLKNAKEFGGISGRALTQKSFLMFKEVAREFFKKAVLISCGGIFNANEAYKRIKYGADLLQIYTSLIYEGPGVVKTINRELDSMLKLDGFSSIKEAKGVLLD